MRRRAPIAVCGLILINVVVFARELSFTQSVPRDAFINLWALIPYDLTHGVRLPPPAPPALATLVTSQFLHGSVVHVCGNMLVLAAFGPDVEALLGHVRTLAFYLVCGTLGNLAQVSAMPASHIPSIGASGAIAGMLGAYVLHFPTRRVIWEIPSLLVIGLWAATQFVHGFGPLSQDVLSERGGGVAYFAHIGGFLAGVLLGGGFAP
jgi:membrane associated rhomboid family serine protease